jgi:hypothetical protein
MFTKLRRTLLRVFATLAMLCHEPAATFAIPHPPGLYEACIVIVPSVQGTSLPVTRRAKAMISRIGNYPQKLRAWRTLRSLLRTGADDGKADRLAKRSLTFGIIAMSALLLAWLPVVGGILLLGVAPMGVLAIVDGLKARRLGSEKSAGLVLGIVSVSLFVLVMIIALLFLIGVLVLLGQ